jgi:prepilin signal peptidase PulO-like enzyme (type II secretory pathway)
MVYLTFSVPIVLLGMAVAFIRFGSIELSTIFSALILNAVVGFVLLWIACHAYNWVAGRFGGIEITLSDVPEEM